MISRKKKKHQKLNLIPILDAIFIFIFFLLMSAQFIDIYEIGSDAPITSTTSEKTKEKPLNLTLVLDKDNITVKTGLDEKIHKTIKADNLAELNNVLIQLKKQYPKETSAILKPNKNFKYKKIVSVIDYTRQIAKPNVYITAYDEQNRKYATKVLFEKIIFDTAQ